MRNLKDNKTISKILKLYFVENLSQREISQKLNISRPKVSRFLLYARKNNLVEIKLKIIEDAFSDLEYEIENEFKIKECIIVNTSYEENYIFQEIAAELKNLLERLLNNDDYLGVDMGSSLKKIFDIIQFDKKVYVSVIPLSGGIEKFGSEGINSNTIAATLAKKLGGISYNINAPCIFNNKNLKEEFNKMQDIKDLRLISKKISTVITSMSDLGHESTLVKTRILNIEDTEYLNSLGIIGDVNFLFLNQYGSHVKNKLDERILKILDENIRKIDNKIGIGFGQRKVKIIYSALIGKFINILITDEKTAHSILSIKNQI